MQTQGDPTAAYPVEDPTIEWDEDASPFVKVAYDHDPEADVRYRKRRTTTAGHLSFTPWHSLPDHRPLGGINRVRRTVYDTVSDTRHQLNMAPRIEPVDLSLPATGN